MNTRINRSTIEFLLTIAENNNREWFQQNKDVYKVAAENFKEFVLDAITGIAEFDRTISLVEPNQCIYRIYRDVRFSSDKSPYKRHFAAYITPQGKNGNVAGYYIHLEPGNVMLSGGIYMAPTKTMQSIREDISYYENDFLSIVESPEFIKNFVFFESDSLKKLPRGFEPGSKVDNYLKMRHITPAKFISNEDVLNDDFLSRIVELCRIMHPLIDFLNRAINQ